MVFKCNQIKNVIFFGTSEIKSIFFSQLSLNMNICVRYGTTKSSSKKDIFHRLFYSCVLFHIGISDHICRNIREKIPISPRSKIVKIYTNTDFPDKVKDIQRPNADIVLLSRIAPGKGHLDVVSACGSIDSLIHFYGGTSDDKFIKKLTKRVTFLGMTSRVIFHGHTKDVHSALQRHSIFVFPSLGEGLGNSLIESLGNGLVCICYDNTVFPEFKKMGFYIHIVKTGDIESLKYTIEEVIRNIDKELLLSKSNIALAQQIFSKHQELEAYKEILV